MTQEQQITFGPFRVDLTQGRLWRGDQAIPLRPRSLALLDYLAAHPGRLVTKAEVREHVWGGTHVTDTVLRVSVREIRVALGDTAGAPRYLETVDRQGYRFLVDRDLEGSPPLAAGPLVGRQGDVAALEAYYQQAAHGTRQLVFISGEAGVGKTTVVEMFLRRLSTEREVWTVRGQCVEHYGEGEPYLPFLEALGRLGHEPAVLAGLRRYAPLWLAQLPGLVSEAELERLQSRLHGTTPARMLRELAEALEVLTAERVLVLVLEDVQWSDRATVEALAYLAQRREPARLLVLGTYRPVEVLLQAHPLRGMVQELGGRGQVSELRLEFLSAADVAAYMAGRLGGPVAVPLTALVAARTDGNALFMVNIVEHLVHQGWVVRQAGQWTLREGVEVPGVSLPEGLRALLLRRIEALAPAARRVLEAASVVGEAFAGAAVAAGGEAPLEDVEVVCDGLAAQRHFLDDTGWTVWPDGTRSGTYRFQHALYRQVLYESLGTMRCVQLHQRIGARLEGGYGAQAGEIATQLAVHFERGGEAQRAVHYLQQAAENAARRNAHHEAIASLTKGLALLATLPDSPERIQYELTLRLALCEPLIAVKGWAAPEVHEAYTQAYLLGQQVGETPQLLQALYGVIRVHSAQGQLRTAGELSQQLLHLAQRHPDPALVLEGHLVTGSLALHRGDCITARIHLEHSLCLLETPQSSPPPFYGGFVSKVPPGTLLIRTLWGLGYADQAQQLSHELLVLAQREEHTLSLVYMELYTALLSQLRRDVVATLAHAKAAMALATAEGAGLRVEQGRLLWGWALAMQGDVTAGVAHIHQGWTAHQDMGPQLLRPYYLSLLAEAYGQAWQPEAGLTVLTEALSLVAATEERWWEAELYRLQGALLCQRPRLDVDQAETCFQQALGVARRQQAKALELRAALSLARLWQRQGKCAAARQLLAELYGWFTEGFDTADLQEAKALLEELGAEGGLSAGPVDNDRPQPTVTGASK
jgi:predicted ATPase/DNA-binding winged helix-turn-helix (wHTH) protein